MLSISLLLLSSINLGNNDVILGGFHKVDDIMALKFYYNTLKHLNSKCNGGENSLLCDKLSTMKLTNISDAREQIVSGKNYDLHIITNLGNLHIKIWQQVAPVRYILQKFNVDDTELLKEELEMIWEYT